MINPKVQFTKIRDVKSPKRANQNDAGSDFFIPNYSEEFITEMIGENDPTKVTYYCDFETDPNKWFIAVAPHAQVLIPSGIRLNILDKNTYFDACNKTGVATKSGLVFTAHIIDADYQGELFFGLTNTSDEIQTLFTGQKVIQLVQKEYVRTEWEEISNEEYENIKVSDRGTGNRGSSGIE